MAEEPNNAEQEPEEQLLPNTDEWVDALADDVSRVKAEARGFWIGNKARLRRV